MKRSFYSTGNWYNQHLLLPSNHSIICLSGYLIVHPVSIDGFTTLSISDIPLVDDQLSVNNGAVLYTCKFKYKFPEQLLNTLQLNSYVRIKGTYSEEYFQIGELLYMDREIEGLSFYLINNDSIT